VAWFLIHQSDDNCTNRIQNTEIKLKKLITDTKTSFLPPSREGIAVKSALNLEMQVLMWVTAKTTQHCIASVLASVPQPGPVQLSHRSLEHPTLRTEVMAFKAAPWPADALCRGSEIFLKTTSLMRKRKKAPKPCQSLL